MPAASAAGGVMTGFLIRRFHMRPGGRPLARNPARRAQCPGPSIRGRGRCPPRHRLARVRPGRPRGGGPRRLCLLAGPAAIPPQGRHPGGPDPYPPLTPEWWSSRPCHAETATGRRGSGAHQIFSDQRSGSLVVHLPPLFFQSVSFFRLINPSKCISPEPRVRPIRPIQSLHIGRRTVGLLQCSFSVLTPAPLQPRT